ncbi:MAG: PEP-CTERM sorting domain-containing protein [Gemmataceae bacterium]|nr:PEP-CTERM sorting domain-containing protein [Gemmataceae bacterium]MDW8244247.1 PEP-CTERM sorting domain-containing protein [Thermogemmata sp.]
MRRVLARAVAWGILLTLGFTWSMPAYADGFWITLAAGLSGASVPSDYNEFWFDSQHGPPLAIVSLNGSFTAQATTGGGATLFSPLGTPVLLPTHDGYATVTPSSGNLGNPSIPSGALPRFAGTPPASGAPLTGLPVPPDSPRLSVGLSPPASDGSRVISVDVTDPNGNPLGSGQVTVPGGGWWVIGLGPDTNGHGGGHEQPPANTPGDQQGDNPGTSPPDSLPPPWDSDDNPDGGAPPLGGAPGSMPPYPDDPGPATTPEPGSVLMVALGGITVAGWRRRRRRPAHA